MTLQEKVITYLWKQDATYEQNNCWSIGVNNGGTINMAIDLENMTFYGSPTNGIIVHSSGNDIALSVNGDVNAYNICINAMNLSANGNEMKLHSENESDYLSLKLRSKDEFSSLTEAQKATCLNVATEGDLNTLKNQFNLKKEKITAFLEIIKFIPALSDNVSEIESLVEDLNNEEI